MRWAILALMAWTAIVVTAAIVIGSPLATPPCAHLIVQPASCASEIAAENARLWTSYTLPFLVVVLGGYAAIVLTGLRARRRPHVTLNNPDEERSS